jgi:hypothetical protein
MLRFLKEEGPDIFGYRLMNTQRQFFLPPAPPLPAPSFAQPNGRRSVSSPPASSPATKPKQLSIPLFMTFAVTVDLVEAAHVPDRCVLEFVNSYGVPERLEV